jgi:hypothetical protein
LPSTAITAFLLLALVFSVLPHTWIESIFGVDPDGGSGVLELMFISVPVAIAFAAYLFRKPARDLRISEPRPLSHNAR